MRISDWSSDVCSSDLYRKSNRSYGATTLLDRHARIAGGRIRLEYRGKSGKQHQVTVDDRTLAREVQRCQDLPGQTLFQFVDEDGARHPVTSGGVKKSEEHTSEHKSRMRI